MKAGYTPCVIVTPNHCSIHAAPCRAMRDEDGGLLVSYGHTSKWQTVEGDFFESKEACLHRCHEMLDSIVERIAEFKRGGPYDV